MTFTELANALADNNEGLNRKKAKEYLYSLCEVMAEALLNGEREISFRGVGKIVVKDYPQRNNVYAVGKDKGKTYITPARKLVRFRCADWLQEEINKE